MLNTILFFASNLVLLLFGIFFSAAFADIQPTRKNCNVFISFSIACGAAQIIVFYFVSEEHIWKLYPFITHIPLIYVLCFYCKKRFATALIAVTTAYLCCQPANFLGKLAFDIFRNPEIESLTRLIVLILTGIILFKFCVSYLARLYTKENRNLYVFGMLPVGYYLYDYLMSIYTSFWQKKPVIAREILPLFLFVIYVLFIIVYYREHELRQVAEEKEQVFLTASQQHKKEVEAIKRSTQEIRLIRHDMRHVLDNINFCLDVNDIEKAKELISGFITHIDATIVARYCKNDTLNYVLSSYVAKCEAHHINLTLDVQIYDIHIDETLFCSILTNAFDNAYNAQMELPEEKRYIKLLIKQANDHILISMKNPFHKKPVLVDGSPVTKERGHGYGTQSIRYLTERLGGNCQFMVQDDMFVVRLVL